MKKSDFYFFIGLTKTGDVHSCVHNKRKHIEEKECIAMNETTVSKTKELHMPGLVQDVYAWMMTALLVTGFTAFQASQTGWIQAYLSGGFFPRLSIFALLLFLSNRLVNSMWQFSLKSAAGWFLAYSALFGILLSSLFARYTTSSILAVCVVTAGTFGVMSLYGYLTKSDLTSTGAWCLMGLIGVLGISLVNLFLASSLIQSCLSCAVILLFLGITAYDTQTLKKTAMDHDLGSTEDGQKQAIILALNLYLDVLNLFLHLLSISGTKKE